MSADPLVLLHGFSGTPVLWEPVRDRLADRHDLLIPTLVGHCGGGVLADGVEASIGAMADELEEQMDAAGFETAHLCGNSLGGWLALELATRGRARSVVAIAPAGGWEAGSAEERRLRRYFRRQYRAVQLGGPWAEAMTRRPGLRRLVLRDVCVHGERFSAAQAAAIVRGAYECGIWADLTAAIERDGPAAPFDVDCPVRIVWGTRDRVLPHGRYSQRFRTLVPDAEFVELAGLGHCPMVDDPELVARMVLEVTARSGQATPAAA